MQKEILEIIKQKLPEQTASEMRIFIEEAERTKKTLDKTQKEFEHKKVAFEDLVKERDDLQIKFNELRDRIKELENRETDVTLRETEVTKREVLQDIEKTKATEAEKRADDLKELTAIVFRNKVMVTQQFDVPMAVKHFGDHYNNNTGQTEIRDTEMVENHGGSKTTTTEQE